MATGETSRRTIVAIPARDESEHIDACMAALAAQDAPHDRFEVVVLVNDTRDDTAARVERWRRQSAFTLHVREVDLPDGGHAGAARKAAMDWAHARIGADADGLICTTDADSEVDPDWLRNTWRAIDRGVDAVAGVVGFAPGRARDLRLSPMRRLETRYAAVQAEVVARLDPQPHDPWPTHLWAWGASLAVRAQVYRAIGGLPPTPLAEDRALIAELERCDFKVRHALDVRVRTSSRAVGRASGGLADLIRSYTLDETTPCDAALEPIADAARRAGLRRRFRRAWETGGAGASPRLAAALGLDRDRIDAALRQSRAGVAWRMLEDASPKLRRRRLAPRALSGEIAQGERILRLVGGESGGEPSAIHPIGLWCEALEQA